MKLKAITSSSFKPLAATAEKVLTEQTYHLAHWKLWIEQLQDSTKEAKTRIQTRVEEAWQECEDVLSLGAEAENMEQFGLISGESFLKKQWLQEVAKAIKPLPESMLDKQSGSGRLGEHTRDLNQALETLSEVYESDKSAVW